MKTKTLTPEDIKVLREMCQELYHQYSNQALDTRLNRRQQELAQTMADEVMTVWEKLPDNGLKFEVKPR